MTYRRKSGMIQRFFPFDQTNEFGNVQSLDEKEKENT